MTNNKLIILRGPSGAGKSTVAKALQKLNENTIIIEQDHYRHTLLKNRPDPNNIVPKMVFADTMIALNADYDVIIEGIFRKEKYLKMFEQLASEFIGKKYFYYFDISFNETVKRHKTREKSNHFSVEEMKDWYSMTQPLGLVTEQIIHENMSKTEIIELIRTKSLYS